MNLTHTMLSGLAVIAMTVAAPQERRSPMHLGNFSVSLAVKDIKASRDFYAKLGFVEAGGNIDQNWLILKNSATKIGLFRGMFERNALTFNPGWDQDGKPDGKSEDVRTIQKRLSDAGLETGAKIESASGPAHFMLSDPDGNPVLIDQHI